MAKAGKRRYSSTSSPAVASHADLPSSVSKFADLAIHPTLLATLTQDLKFDSMMPVQALALPHLLPPARADALVQAKTGTGKTVAFLLPAIQTLISKNPRTRDGLSLLVISPTRELAMQIGVEAEAILQRMGIYKVAICIGGTNKAVEAIRLGRTQVDILVATPGRLLDNLSSSRQFAEKFQNLETLVLDEADRLLDMGFLQALKQIIEYLPKKSTKNRQGMLFSATLPQRVQSVAGLVLSPGYKHISTIQEGELGTHHHVPQYVTEVPTFADLAPALVGAIRDEVDRLGQKGCKAIIFAPTAGLVGFYHDLLQQVDGFPPVFALHSRLSQTKRTRVTMEYRAATNGLLIATDVIARGMDFPGVTTVFQAGLPQNKEAYIHRLGRTARAGQEGHGILILTTAEMAFQSRMLKEFALVDQPANLSFKALISPGLLSMTLLQKQKVYQSWLGFYKDQCALLGWSQSDLIEQANEFGRLGLLARDPIPIDSQVVGKMGLRHCKGLCVVKNLKLQDSVASGHRTN